MSSTPLRVMAVVAHQDDFEFNAGGTFALLWKTLGDGVEFKILTTSRGAAGHHELGLDDTFARRREEATRSAALIGAEYECLTRLDGSHAEVQVLPDRNLLGGLWNAIRAFEPNVIFCPPVVTDPLAGVHIDHISTAHAVRLVAYQLCVPRAYPTMDGPVKLRVPNPLVINMDDVYAREEAFDVREDVSEVYDLKCRMALCHESQIYEWLPFTSGREEPMTQEEWLEQFKKRHRLINERYGCGDDTPSEFFRITRWGRAPEEGEVDRLFPRRIGGKVEGFGGRG